MDQVTKLNWIKKLHVGSLVCDCRCRHLRVASLEPCYIALIPTWMKDALLHESLPVKLQDALWDAALWVYRKMGWTYLYDQDLILEDGAHCSARHCCDDQGADKQHPRYTLAEPCE